MVDKPSGTPVIKGLHEKQPKKQEVTQMVKKQKKRTTKRSACKGFDAKAAEPRQIKASTSYGTCTEQLSAFGGLLALVKFLDLVKFKEIFELVYRAPFRAPKLGYYPMVVGVLMLLFIGFNRL